ncbi:hypothetical protein Z968_11900 [Clostridium novyi A str. 4552]|uniref:RDD domain-containing protein n=1 Tax=Clostridium novyi A str. 4552 TaxID=1444289 RepID=A0A0A0I1U1_CLONO|nr:RDD family protein [Clostridium novyi]KGM94286.1 hypothetical protein Z968_11900 [Clostridium novyi A str. 4552]
MSEENNVNTKEEVTEINDKESYISKVNFKDTFTASIIDILVTLGMSIVVLFVIDGILRVTAGYYIVEKIQMTAIIYLIVSLLYTSIMQSKSCDTVGMRVAKLKISK